MSLYVPWGDTGWKVTGLKWPKTGLEGGWGYADDKRGKGKNKEYPFPFVNDPMKRRNNVNK